MYTKKKKEKGAVEFLLLFVILGLIGVVVGAYILGKGSSSPAKKGSSKDFPRIPTESDYFELVDSFTAVPDGYFTNGAFCRVNYFDSKDKFYLTFGTGLYSGEEPYNTPGFAYKEYSKDFKDTGVSGFFSLGAGQAAGDGAMTMDDEGFFYFLTGYPEGFWIKKYNQNFEQVGDIKLPMQKEEIRNDQMLVFVNGMLDASGLYVINPPVTRPPDPNEPTKEVSKNPPPPDPEGSDEPIDQRSLDHTKGEATHHRFVSKDLEFIKRRVLGDETHVNGHSMVYVDGVYNLVSSTSYFGDIIVLRYDQDWNFLGKKLLAEDGRWPQGSIFVDDKFYVTYTSANGNVVLSMFDKNWNHIESLQVTDFKREDSPQYQADRPSIFYHNGLFYVSHDAETFNPKTHQTNRDWECRVSIYRLKK